MKEELASLLRHALTALAGIGTLLAARGCIADEDIEAVNAAGAGVTEAVIVVVVAIAARFLLSWMGRFGMPVAKSGGTTPLLLVAGGLAVLVGPASLTSCADYNGPRFVLGVEGDEAKVSYDSAKGGTVRVDARVPAIRGSK